MIAPPAPATPSPNQQQLIAISLDLDAVRQSVDRIAASQDQLTREITNCRRSNSRSFARIQSLLRPSPFHGQRADGQIGPPDPRHAITPSITLNGRQRSRSLSPKILEPVRRQGRIDRRARDRAMTEPPFDRPVS
jgi:hypothetical protein